VNREPPPTRTATGVVDGAIVPWEAEEVVLPPPRRKAEMSSVPAWGDDMEWITVF